MKLVLAMIVKNEENTILRTLSSCLDIIDKAYICDTGSTDKTIELIKKQIPDTKLNLMTDVFVDFSTNRNKVLKSIEEQENKDCFVLLLDANDEVKNGKDLLDFLKENPNHDLYNTNQEWDDIGKKYRFVTNRVMKNNCTHAYKGLVHEVLLPKDTEYKSDISFLIPEFCIYQNRNTDINAMNEHTTMPRLERDYKLLMQEYAVDPKNGRNLYYLNQTLYFMTKFEECKKYCEERFQDETPDEETYQSMLRYAKCSYLLKEDWANTEKYLWRAHNFISKLQDKFKELHVLDIEPLAIIAFEYYSQQKFKEAYEMAKVICNTPIPNTSLPKDASIYNYKRWLLLANLCDKYNDNSTGFTACNKALSSEEVTNVAQFYREKKLKPHEKELVDNVSTLNTLRNKFDTELDKQYHRISDKPLLVIYGGVSYIKWNGNNIKMGKGLGGAETAAVNVAENLAKNYKVVMFADTEERVTVNDVEYMRLSDYNGYVATHHIDTLIILRFADAIRYGYNIKSVYLWLQDIDFIGKGFVNDPSLRGIITLCKSHADYIKQKWLPKEMHNLVKVVGNAINYERFADLVMTNKVKNRFIYSSCPTRGLEYLLEIFPDILKMLPDAELHVYSDFENGYAMQFSNIQEMGKKLKENKYKNVFSHGRTDQNTLAQEIKKSEYWLYPTIFPETYCITSLEMMAGGVVCVCSNLWALSEVVTNDRGFMLNAYQSLVPEVDEKDKDAKDKKLKLPTEKAKNVFKQEILNVFNKMTDASKLKKIKAGIEFAKKQTWQNISKNWNTLIK